MNEIAKAILDIENKDKGPCFNTLIVFVLKSLLLSPQGALISDQTLVKIYVECFGFLHLKSEKSKLNRNQKFLTKTNLFVEDHYNLRDSAKEALKEITVLIFTRLESFDYIEEVEDEVAAYQFCGVRDVLKYLIRKTNPLETDKTISHAYDFLIVALKASMRFLFKFPSLANLLDEDLYRNIISIMLRNRVLDQQSNDVSENECG